MNIKRILLSTVSLLFTFNIANAASNVVAILEGEISGFGNRDKVTTQLLVTPDADGKFRFSQCTTINKNQPSCEWLANGRPFSIDTIKAIQVSIPNDTVRVFTDASTSAAEARNFLRTDGSALVQAIELAYKGTPTKPVQAFRIYNNHEVFPYILWRARTF